MDIRIIIGGARRRGEQPPAAPDLRRDLERHLARCRRSAARAALLVARVGGDAAFPLKLEQHLRTTDSAARSDAGELLLLCDDPARGGDAPRLDRDALEHRLRGLAGGHVLCTWASFPDDGLLVDDLLRHARGAVAPVTTPLTLLTRTG
jgi:hypothetical protein